MFPEVKSGPQSVSLMRFDLFRRHIVEAAAIEGPQTAFWEITPRKSLAPYRDCRGGECAGTMIIPVRGSFDRGDLKEAAGGAGRAMEPQARFRNAAKAACGRCMRPQAFA